MHPKREPEQPQRELFQRKRPEFPSGVTSAMKTTMSSWFMKRKRASHSLHWYNSDDCKGCKNVSLRASPFFSWVLEDDSLKA
jgi:hypothetical protein